MQGVQCYELFGGIALNSHAFFNPLDLFSCVVAMLFKHSHEKSRCKVKTTQLKAQSYFEEAITKTT